MRTRGARAPLSSSARASPFPPLRFPPERERTRQHRQGEQPRTVSGLLSLRELGPLSTRARARLPPKFAEPIARIYFTPSSRNSTKIRRKWSTSFSNSIPSDLIEGQFFFLIPCLAPTLIARHEFRTTEVILVNAVGLLACFLDVGMPMVSYACKSTLAKSLPINLPGPFELSQILPIHLRSCVRSKRSFVTSFQYTRTQSTIFRRFSQSAAPRSNSPVSKIPPACNSRRVSFARLPLARNFPARKDTTRDA